MNLDIEVMNFTFALLIYAFKFIPSDKTNIILKDFFNLFYVIIILFAEILYLNFLYPIELIPLFS